MARARNIKPGFFKNYELADLGPMAQLLFSGLWCLADREGRLEDKPRLIKAELFPYYDCDVNGELTELQRLKFVDRYVVDGVAVIQVVNFRKHQTPHNTEKASVLPEKRNPPSIQPNEINDNGGFTVDSRNLNDGKTPDSLIHRFTDSPIPDSLNPESENKNISASPRRAKPDTDEIAKIFDFWKKTMDSPKSALDKPRTGLIAKALQNYSPAEVCQAIRGCSRSPYHMGQNDRATKYNGLDLILRNAEKIDQFIALDGGNARAGPPDSIAQANARAEAMLFGNQNDDERTIDMEQ